MKDFLLSTVAGIPVFALIVVAILAVLFIANVIRSKAKRDKLAKEEKAEQLVKKLKAQAANEDGEAPAQVPEVQPKKTKGWWKPSSVIGFAPVVLIVLIAVAIFTGNIQIGIPYGNVWLILALIGGLLFIYMSNTCKMIVAPTTIVIAILLVAGLVRLGMAVPSLMGTPEATLIKPVDMTSGKPFEYDVSHPHWTGYYLEVPDNTWLEITAKGRHHFLGKSTLFKNDRVKSCGPEGATFRVAHFMNGDLNRSIPHLPHPDNFPIPGGHYAALIGKVDEDGEVFEIGKYRKIFIEDGGLLYISSNLRFVGSDWRMVWEKVSSGTIYFSIKMSPKI